MRVKISLIKKKFAVPPAIATVLGEPGRLSGFRSAENSACCYSDAFDLASGQESYAMMLKGLVCVSTLANQFCWILKNRFIPK